MFLSRTVTNISRLKVCHWLHLAQRTMEHPMHRHKTLALLLVSSLPDKHSILRHVDRLAVHWTC